MQMIPNGPGMAFWEEGEQWNERALPFDVKRKKSEQAMGSLLRRCGGQGGIRTHGTLAGTPDFEGVACLRKPSNLPVSSYNVTAGILGNTGIFIICLYLLKSSHISLPFTITAILLHYCIRKLQSRTGKPRRPCIIGTKNYIIAAPYCH